MDWEFGVSRCTEWMNNRVSLHSTGKVFSILWYSIMAKNLKNNAYTHIPESFCCTQQKLTQHCKSTTLQLKKKQTSKQSFSSLHYIYIKKGVKMFALFIYFWWGREKKRRLKKCLVSASKHFPKEWWFIQLYVIMDAQCSSGFHDGLNSRWYVFFWNPVYFFGHMWVVPWVPVLIWKVLALWLHKWIKNNIKTTFVEFGSGLIYLRNYLTIMGSDI